MMTFYITTQALKVIIIAEYVGRSVKFPDSSTNFILITYAFSENKGFNLVERYKNAIITGAWITGSNAGTTTASPPQVTIAIAIVMARFFAVTE